MNYGVRAARDVTYAVMEAAYRSVKEASNSRTPIGALNPRQRAPRQPQERGIQEEAHLSLALHLLRQAEHDQSKKNCSQNDRQPIPAAEARVLIVFGRDQFIDMIDVLLHRNQQ
jgi:hypothetical protein